MSRLVLTHGGVDMAEDEATYATLRRACASAARQGRPVDAVVAGLGVLEDDPRFNAGYGSVLTATGTVEVDAAIVDGSTGRYGAVGAVPDLRHPSAVAAEILHRDGPVLLSGEGAAQFARSVGHDPSVLTTEEQVRAWRDFREHGMVSPFTGRPVSLSTETVGCIVLEKAATAGSSTGGVCGKHPGRIGDSAILGAGIWVDENVAVLCSGAGEAMIKLGLARGVSDRVRSGDRLDEAVDWGVATAASRLGVVAAVLAVDVPQRMVAAAHCGSSFPVMAQDETGQWIVDARALPGP